ncbi:MAG: indolepyruvate ferredoxin oxidoreductase subunit alpha [Promethearchaeota archaeon]
MVVTKEEIEILFKKMMKDLEGCTQTDETYQEDMKNVDGLIKLQWLMCGMVGYQIFGKDSYSYKFGERLEHPSATIETEDKELASKFLNCEPFEFSYASIEGGFEISYVEGWKVMSTDKGKSDRTKITRPFLTIQINPEAGLHLFVLSKLPMFREWAKKHTEGEKEYGSYIPINKSLGTFENYILPIKVFKHFIDKASNIVIRDCPCRVHYECKDHKKSLGCMMMGDATLNMAMPKDNKGRVVTKEEALEHVRLSIEDGLVPVLGRSAMEAEGYDVKDTAHFLSCCFCCTCCCINGKVITTTSVVLTSLYQRIEGLTVEVDRDICVGCGECLKACIFNGREIIDGKAKVNQKRCLGCGRCENICPKGAISIIISDPTRIDDLINKLEDYVDVS